MNPKGWHDTDLASVVVTMESGSRPKGGVSVDSGEVASLGGENILQSGGVSLAEVKRVPVSFFERMSKGKLENDDVLINKDGAQTGKVGLYKVGEGPACINEHLFLIRGDTSKITQEYLYYMLLSEQGQSQIAAQITGSAQPGLKSNFLRGVKTSIPNSTVEQSTITRILTQIELAIQETEAAIEKQQRIKDGLVHALLTRGLDQMGHLRSEQKHHFKDSTVGMIPAEWDISELGRKAFVTKLAGFEFTKYFDYQAGGEIIALRALNIKRERLDLSDVQRISLAVSKKLPRSKIYANDILITYIGAYIGDILRIHEDDKYHLAPNIAKVVAGNTLAPQFLEWVLRSQGVRRQINNLIATTATPSLTMT